MASSIGQRGKKAEGMMQRFLEKISAAHAAFDFLRLPDARAAMGRMKAMPGDFEFFTPSRHGIIEAKETAHEYRLPKDKVPQMAMLKKRELAGGQCWVTVYHTTLDAWRFIPVSEMEHISSGSWDLRKYPLYKTIEGNFNLI